MCCENDDAVEWKRQVPSTLPLMPAQDHPPSLAPCSRGITAVPGSTSHKAGGVASEELWKFVFLG